MSPVLSALLPVTVLAIGLGGYAILAAARGRPSRHAPEQRAELESLRILVDDLKETAWDHRDIDETLSVIFIDKIRTHEHQQASDRDPEGQAPVTALTRSLQPHPPKEEPRP